jgi:hypothetical protein
VAVTETGVADELVTGDCVAVSVEAPAQFVRPDEVEKQKLTVVEPPFALTEPFNCAVGSVKFVAASVVALGRLTDVPVVNETTGPYVVPTEFVATGWM